MNQRTLGGRIKFHRKRLHMTQEQLAERMGVSAQAVSKWENDLSCPDISALPDLASVFGISVDALLGRAEAETVHEPEIVQDEDDDENEVESKWHRDAGGILFALFILTVGGLLLVGRLFDVPASGFDILWQTALVYIGISGLIGGFSMFSAALTLAGGYFLLSEFGILDYELRWSVFLPVILLLWGLSLLLDVFFGKKPWRRRKHARRWKPLSVNVGSNHKLQHEFSCTDGIFNCDMSFGEYSERVETPLLKGGSIETGFGDFTVDFSGCEAIAEDCIVDVDNSFGHLTLLVPQKFAVQVKNSEHFASSIDWVGSPAADPVGILNLKVDNSFGSLTVEYI